MATFSKEHKQLNDCSLISITILKLLGIIFDTLGTLINFDFSNTQCVGIKCPHFGVCNFEKKRKQLAFI